MVLEPKQVHSAFSLKIKLSAGNRLLSKFGDVAADTIPFFLKEHVTSSYILNMKPIARFPTGEGSLWQR